MIKTLINSGADVNATSTGSQQGWTPIFFAIDSEKNSKRTEITDLLIRHKADVNYSHPLLDNQPLHAACYLGGKKHR